MAVPIIKACVDSALQLGLPEAQLPLSEAVILPLCPDKGPCMTYDLTRAASTYLDGDIEQLRRMR